MAVVKGVSRRVIVVDSPDPNIFEQAIFILRSDGGGVSQQQVVEQAQRVAKCYARTHGLQHDPADVGNLISGSSAFPKTSLNIRKFTGRQSCGARVPAL